MPAWPLTGDVLLQLPPTSLHLVNSASMSQVALSSALVSSCFRFRSRACSFSLADSRASS